MRGIMWRFITDSWRHLRVKNMTLNRTMIAFKLAISSVILNGPNQISLFLMHQTYIFPPCGMVRNPSLIVHMIHEHTEGG